MTVSLPAWVPVYENDACPLPFVVPEPLAVIAPLTENRIDLPDTAFPP